MEDLPAIVARLANRDAKRAEATVQADIRTLLLTAPLSLEDEDIRLVELESAVGDRRRIDVETGTTVIEVKRDLRRAGVLPDAVDQLRGYVEAREKQTRNRYVGIITDGADWRCYHLTAGGLAEADAHCVSADDPDVEALLVWLEGVLATVQDLKPTPEEIERRLGARSSSHALDRSTLAELYARNKDNPSVRVKRQLWAHLLRTALGTQFEDRDDLFVEHTLLVNSAEIIAHAVLGLRVQHLEPAQLLSGGKFVEHGIHGVVESDFFDWVVEATVPGGENFIRTLARRLARFDWSQVEHDVLKVLYESIIGRATRKKLGEYYTPDWLAEAVVANAVRHPLQERVLDPACGSGTFVFHAVRAYLGAADAAGHSVAEGLEGVTRHVIGMDLHPVAVTLARVTYLLAIGRERLSHPERPNIQVPVFLGDSMQWQHDRPQLRLWSKGHLVIHVDDELRQKDLFSDALQFPDVLLEDAEVFDRFVQELALRASKRKRGSPIPSLKGLFRRFGIDEESQAVVTKTFRTMCQLHDDDRDHIWGYYIRNLVRPMWLSRTGNHVDTLIGNPPWLAYRFMTKEMQDHFREMSEVRGLWHGSKVATHQDLSGLFVARAIQLYLRKGGHFAFVMPNAVLDRSQFAGLRSGRLDDSVAPVWLSFDRCWDLRRLRPHFFPRASAVIFGSREDTYTQARAIPEEIELWSGRLPARAASWTQVEPLIRRGVSHRSSSGNASAKASYRNRFRQGATVVPRVLFMVEELPPGPLGVPHGKVRVRSVRSAYEKTPWKDLDSVEGVIESEFVLPVYLGEDVLPYRLRPPHLAILPIDTAGVIAAEPDRLELYPGLADWWRRVETLWTNNRSSERLSLTAQLDYHGKLSSQLPVQPRRVVYTKSGMHLAATRIDERRALIDHKLYWAGTRSLEEARYLCAILNAAVVTRLVRPLMSYGKDERDIDKHVWNLGIPEFDATKQLHNNLVSLAMKVEEEVSALPLRANGFTAQRREIREYMEQSKAAQEIETVVEELLGE